MFQFLRSLAFQILFFILTSALSVVFFPALLLPKQVLFYGFELWAHIITFLLRFVCGARWSVIDAPEQTGAFIAAGKHQSAWETLVLCLVLRRPAFVAKKELIWLPFIGWYMWKIGMIPIDRSGGPKALRKMLKAARSAQAEGRPIVIFPEGTRVPVGEKRPYQPGVAALYRQLDLPVYPFALNSGLVWPRNAFHRYPGVITVAFQAVIRPGLQKAAFLAALEEAIEPATQALLRQAPLKRG